MIALDLVGLQRLELVGPVDVVDTDGKPMTVTADNVLTEMLLKQYLGSDTVGRTARPAVGRRPGGLPCAERTGVRTGRLLAAQSAGRGRHLMMWSDDPVQQAGWEALDASGAPPATALPPSVLNRAATSLDQFLRVTADMT